MEDLEVERRRVMEEEQIMASTFLFCRQNKTPKMFDYLVDLIWASGMST